MGKVGGGDVLNAGDLRLSDFFLEVFVDIVGDPLETLRVPSPAICFFAGQVFAWDLLKNRLEELQDKTEARKAIILRFPEIR